MGATDDFVQLGTYGGTLTENITELRDLLGDPDEVRSDGRAGGSNLDEMSPVARAQLYAEVSALLTASNAGGDGVAYGQHTVTAGEATANTLDIDTGLGDDIGDGNLAVTISRAGSIVTADAAISEAAGVITVADGSTYNVTAGDIVTWFAILPSA